jgi:hypothetical protein
MYKHHCRNCDRLAREAAGLAPTLLYRRPQHTCGALLKSACYELFDRAGEKIDSSVSRLRRKFNFNYYLFCDYAYYTGRTFKRKVSNRHFSTAVASIGKVCRFIASPKADFACINDVNMSEEKYVQYRRRLLEAFVKAFPYKSRFEI